MTKRLRDLKIKWRLDTVNWYETPEFKKKIFNSTAIKTVISQINLQKNICQDLVNHSTDLEPLKEEISLYIYSLKTIPEMIDPTIATFRGSKVNRLVMFMKIVLFHDKSPSLAHRRAAITVLTIIKDQFNILKSQSTENDI
jgi:hypothetical protein